MAELNFRCAVLMPQRIDPRPNKQLQKRRFKVGKIFIFSVFLTRRFQKQSRVSRSRCPSRSIHVSYIISDRNGRGHNNGWCPVRLHLRGYPHTIWFGIRIRVALQDVTVTDFSNGSLVAFVPLSALTGIRIPPGRGIYFRSHSPTRSSELLPESASAFGTHVALLTFLE